MAKPQESIHYGVSGFWTPLQIAFVTAYFECGQNKAKAAELAGSKSSDPRKIGYELSNVEHVKKAIDRETPKRLSNLEETIKLQLLTRLHRLAFADRAGIYKEDFTAKPLSDWTEEQKDLLVGVSSQTASDGSVIRTPKLIPLDSVMQQLAKAVGLHRERIEMSNDALAHEAARFRDRAATTAERIQKALAEALSSLGEESSVDK